ncbi:MAG TPA: hypothetical protein VMS09_06580 [Paenibacillus sp.]|uniref:hypothetical protein n=1 Tax=Paenibacillus sp. TaxID=58172 RepID=UPI0028D6F1F7|nr:hypothetical protein [Paenibacillus sp.]HUC91686.1 hypothetical protein [Paenibacillus sp.]
MEKKKYYISVQGQTIMEQQGDAAYELEIEANSEEIEKLRKLFVMLKESDHNCFFRAQYLAIPYHHDNSNDRYDYYLKEIYNYIYELGTDETKQHLASITDSLNTMGWAEEK